MYYEQIPPKLRELVGRDEKILWYGKPDKKCFILQSFLNASLIFSLLWVAIASFFIYAIITDPETPNVHFALGKALPFFFIWLFPVWFYIGNALTSFGRYENTFYIVTDRAVYRSKGWSSIKCEKEPFAAFREISLNIGLLDKIIGVGTIRIKLNYHKKEYINLQQVVSDFSICDIYGAQGVYYMIKDAWAAVNRNDIFQSDNRYSYAREMQILSDKENYQKEYFDSLNKKKEPILDKENLQAEYFKNIDKNNSVVNIVDRGVYHNNNYPYEYVDEMAKNIQKTARTIKLIRKVFIVYILFVLLMVLVSFIVQTGAIPKDFGHFHISFSLGSKENINNNKSSKAIQKIVSQDFKEANQLHLNKIISKVKNYQLREGITLEEKIKLLHPDIYDTLKWEASQLHSDMTYYFVTLSLPTSAGITAQTLYRFNYNSVSYNVEPMTSETNKMMNNLYQEEIKD